MMHFLFRSMAEQQRNLKAIVMRATENTWCAVCDQE